MIRIVAVEIIYLMLNLYFYHARGDFVDFTLVKKQNRLLQPITNSFISSDAEHDRLKIEQQRSADTVVMNIPGIINFQRRKARTDNLNAIFPVDISSYGADSITKPYKHHKTKVSSVLGTIFFDSTENNILKEINSTQLGQERLTAKKTEVDTKKKELIPSNETRLQTQSYNFLDEFQAIKANQQIPRKKITTHLSGIKGFTLNGNYSGRRKSAVKSSISVLERRKRNSKQAKISYEYLFDDLELNNLSEVYKYFHSVLNTLKHHINFTMRSGEDNKTSDAENLCISTFEAYYGDSESK